VLLTAFSWTLFAACTFVPRAVGAAGQEPVGEGPPPGTVTTTQAVAADPAPSDDAVGEVAPVPGGLDADAILAMTPDECRAKLDEWKVPYEVPDEPPASIDAPIRFSGPVAGVTFAIPWTATNGNDVLDCRLGAALAEWAVLLRERKVVEVRLYSFYRRGTRHGVTAARAQGQLSQHHYGLAIDARWFVLEGGEVLDVAADFVDPGTDDTCSGASDDAEASVLLDIYCAGWAARLFHVQLSPAHNRQHANHFHLDVGGANGGWYLD
jgi:hypothetical protein